MRDLTEAEVGQVYDATKQNDEWSQWPKFTHHAFYVRFANAILAKYGIQPSETEIREREREAFRQGVIAERASPLGSGRFAVTELDRLYPLPSPPKEILKFMGKLIDELSREEMIRAIHTLADRSLIVP
jgi:hypothetical protein